MDGRTRRDITAGKFSGFDSPSAGAGLTGQGFYKRDLCLLRSGLETFVQNCRLVMLSQLQEGLGCFSRPQLQATRLAMPPARADHDRAGFAWLSLFLVCLLACLSFLFVRKSGAGPSASLSRLNIMAASPIPALERLLVHISPCWRGQTRSASRLSL